MPVAVRTVTTLDEFAALRETWAALSAAGAGDPLFGSHAWNLTWWEHYQNLGELRVLVAADAGEVVGILPLFSARRTFGDVQRDMMGDRKMPLPGKGIGVSVLAYLGSGEICSDYLQPLLAPGREAEIAAALLGELKAQHDWHVLDLCDMPGEGATIEAVRAALAKHFGKFRERFRYVVPFATLPGSYDDYLKTLSKKSRFNARKKVRQLELNHRVEHTFHDDPATLATAVDTLIELHQRRWTADGLPGVFVNDRFIGFHRAMAAAGLESGWLRLGILRINDEATFATYAYQVGDRVYLYQQGSATDPHWDRYNLGYVALGFALAAAADGGMREYDFLRGDAAYKLHWAPERRSLVQLQAVRGFRGQLFMLHSAINTDDRLRQRVKGLLGRNG
jgi:CelD/BcsL family acetyltransferase involved in cellulose biosynthesis